MEDGTHACTIFCWTSGEYEELWILLLPSKGRMVSWSWAAMPTTKIWTTFLKAAQLSRWHMGSLYWFPPSTGWTRSKKQHKKARIWISILWLRLSLYTVQNQTQWNLTSFQANAVFLREVAAGSAGHIHHFQLQMGRIQTFHNSYAKALNTANFRHYPINQQVTQNEKSQLIKARALASSLKRSTIKCTDISAHRHRRKYHL